MQDGRWQSLTTQRIYLKDDLLQRHLDDWHRWNQIYHIIAHAGTDNKNDPWLGLDQEQRTRKISEFRLLCKYVQAEDALWLEIPISVALGVKTSDLPHAQIR